MRLHLVTFGKLKTPGLREATEYYAKLLSGFMPLVETELKPLSVPDKSSVTRRQIQEKESSLLLEKLDQLLSGRGVFYLLDEGGKSLSTAQWVRQVRDWERDGIPDLAFCIGSSLGFSEEVKKRARGKLALGPQTLPHELARVVLLEQLYRAWSVTRNHPYHVEG